MSYRGYRLRPTCVDSHGLQWYSVIAPSGLSCGFTGEGCAQFMLRNGAVLEVSDG